MNKEEKKLKKKSAEFGGKLWKGEPIDLLDFYKTMKKLKKIEEDKGNKNSVRTK